MLNKLRLTKDWLRSCASSELYIYITVVMNAECISYKQYNGYANLKHILYSFILYWRAVVYCVIYVMIVTDVFSVCMTAIQEYFSALLVRYSKNRCDYDGIADAFLPCCTCRYSYNFLYGTTVAQTWSTHCTICPPLHFGSNFFRSFDLEIVVHGTGNKAAVGTILSRCVKLFAWMSNCKLTSAPTRLHLPKSE